MTFTFTFIIVQKGFPGGSVGKCRFDPWVGKIPWRRKWQPNPVFLPGKFQEKRSLADYSPWGHNELGMTGHKTRLLAKAKDLSSLFVVIKLYFPLDSLHCPLCKSIPYTHHLKIRQGFGGRDKEFWVLISGLHTILRALVFLFLILE